MRILIATDAWHPQVNGVVRTLTSLARSASVLGAEIDFLTPDGFPSFGVPTYPGLRMAWPNRREIAARIEAASPDAIHIATEGPIGWAVRAYCRRRKLAFTTSYTTRFPEYIAVRSIIPPALSYAVLRHFHAAAAMTMVATASLRQELGAAGFGKLGTWTRGVDTDLFRPDDPAELDLPQADFHDDRPRRGREKPRGVSLAGFAGIQGRDRGGTAEGGVAAPLSEGQIPRREDRQGSDVASGGGRRLCFPEPAPTRSASFNSKRWRAARRSRRSRSPARWMSSRTIRSAHWTTTCAAPASRALEHVARDLPEFCAGAFLGKQRKAVHRQSDARCSRAVRCGRPAAWPAKAPCRANRPITISNERGSPWQKSSN